MGARRGRALTRRELLSALALGAMALGGCSTGTSDDEERQADVPQVLDRVLEEDSSGEGSSEVSVLMVGDVLVHPSVWQSGERDDGTRDYAHLFEQVLADIAEADIALVNQETILGGDELGLSGYPTFNGPQEICDAEAQAGFDVVLHANNHALDKGLTGIGSELAYWRANHPEVAVTGIADSEEEFDVVPVLERAGHRVAILNYATGTNGIELPEPWAVRMIGEERIAEDVSLAREAGAEAIIACPHWGTEYAAAPDEEQLRWAQVLADAGVDAILGDHPHVVQPIEVIQSADGRDVPVFWSVGNFVSGQERKDTMVGGIARVTLSFSTGAARVSECRLTPVVTNKAGETGLTTYRLADYTEELAQGNGIRGSEGCSDFSRQWCVDFCAERLGEAFDPDSCELVLTL